MRTILFTPWLLSKVRRFNQFTGKERCGLIFDTPNRGFDLFEVPNVHKDPTKHFAISTFHTDPLFEKYGSHETLFRAVFHTHVSAIDKNPSEHDLEQIERLRQRWPSLMGIVYNVSLGLLVEYSEQGPGRRLLIATKGDQP